MKKMLALILCVAMCFALGAYTFADVATTDPSSSDVPSTDVPSSDVPSTDVPSSDVPSTDVPSSDVPGTDVPSTDVPGTDVPGTDVPGTDVPGTDVPGTDVPSTDVPGTDVPGTDVPGTDVPGTDVPSTDVPSSDVPTTDPANKFVDVADDHVFAEEIYWCADNGYMIGYKDNTFRPANNITRAQVCTIFWRLAGAPTGAADAGYADAAYIASDYVVAVNWAKANGVMIGYYDNCFRPDQAITREEFVAVFYRFVGSPATAGSLAGFADAADVKAPFVNAMAWAVENGIVIGYNDNTLLPQNTLTRGAMAAIVYRYFGNVASTEVA